MNKTKVRCVTANLQLSPKPEDCVIQYRFHPLDSVQGHAGDVLLESAFALYLPRTAPPYVLGQEYELSIEVK